MTHNRVTSGVAWSSGSASASASPKAVNAAVAMVPPAGPLHYALPGGESLHYQYDISRPLQQISLTPFPLHPAPALTETPVSPNEGSQADCSPDPAAGADGEEQGGPTLKQNFYDPQAVKHRRRTTPHQLLVLNGHFLSDPKPDMDVRKQLAATLGMTTREVQVWYQNRRAKQKKINARAANSQAADVDSADGQRSRSSGSGADPEDSRMRSPLDGQIQQSSHGAVQSSERGLARGRPGPLPYQGWTAPSIGAAQTETPYLSINPPDHPSLASSSRHSSGVSSSNTSLSAGDAYGASSYGDWWSKSPSSHSGPTSSNSASRTSSAEDVPRHAYSEPISTNSSGLTDTSTHTEGAYYQMPTSVVQPSQTATPASAPPAQQSFAVGPEVGLYASVLPGESFVQSHVTGVTGGTRRDSVPADFLASFQTLQPYLGSPPNSATFSSTQRFQQQQQSPLQLQPESQYAVPEASFAVPSSSGFPPLQQPLPSSANQVDQHADFLRRHSFGTVVPAGGVAASNGSPWAAPLPNALPFSLPLSSGEPGPGTVPMSLPPSTSAHYYTSDGAAGGPHQAYSINSYGLPHHQSVGMPDWGTAARPARRGSVSTLSSIAEQPGRPRSGPGGHGGRSPLSPTFDFSPSVGVAEDASALHFDPGNVSAMPQSASSHTRRGSASVIRKARSQSKLYQPYAQQPIREIAGGSLLNYEGMPRAN